MPSRADREAANERLRLYRCAELCYRLVEFGFAPGFAIYMAEGVWGPMDSWTKRYIRLGSPKLIGVREREQ